MRSVLVVYAHRARAEALGVVIDSQPDLVWAGAVEQSEVEHAEEVSPNTVGDPPDVAVIEGGDAAKITSTIRTLRDVLPEVHIVVVTDAPDPATLADAAEAGAEAFVSDRDSLNHLLGAVRTASSDLLLLPAGTFTELVRVVARPPRASGGSGGTGGTAGQDPSPGDRGGHTPRAGAGVGAVAEVIDLRAGDGSSPAPLGSHAAVSSTSPHRDLDERRTNVELEQAYRRSGLTARERDVLVLLAQGLDAQGIARELFMSVHTARGHLKSIMMKLGVHSQLEAVVTAARMGLLPDFPEPASAR